MEERMKKIGRRMSVCMGVTLSFCLSLVGTWHGTRRSPQGFTVSGWLVSFLVSLVISLAIGLIVPMGRVSRAVNEKCGRGTLKAHLADALVSNLIYTPLITLIMVFINWSGAKRGAMAAARAQGAPAEATAALVPGFWQTFLPSLILCFIVGYVIIFLVQPLYMKLLMKENVHG